MKDIILYDMWPNILKGILKQQNIVENPQQYFLEGAKNTLLTGKLIGISFSLPIGTK